MRINLLGTGTPILDSSRQHSSLLVECAGTNLLFDAGRGITSQMLKLGTHPRQVDAIFITHHHYDHICDLGEFLMTAWHNGRITPVNIYGPQGTVGIVNALLGQVFARDIAFTLSVAPETMDIHSLVRVTDVLPGWVQNNGTWKIRVEQTEHGNPLTLPYEAWPCLGYRLEADGKSIAISGDTVTCAGLDRIAKNSDVLLQCCYLAEAEVNSPEAELQSRSIIASSGQVGKIAARNNVRKLVLTHIRPKSEALMQSMLDDIRKDFPGEVVIGEDLMMLDV
jgi:ribonuclease BN (tRNA processing enzyme)